MAIKAILWDLDGTLLDTLLDLAASTNAALAMHGMPQRSVDEVRSFVGNGIGKLIARAVPQGTDEGKTACVLADFTAHYAAHSRDHTAPYPGVMDMLDALDARGIAQGIVSNKIDFAVKDLSRLYFGERMRVNVGDDPSRARKPAPDSVLEAMRQLGVAAKETLYVGDSEVDVATAKNAGVRGLAVSWGFRTEAALREAGAETICSTPEALLAAIFAL